MLVEDGVAEVLVVGGNSVVELGLDEIVLEEDA